MFAERLTRKWGGANVWFKREDLAHTGAHKINNALGQMLLAERMGKTRIIAETGAGQHGVATATVAALYGSECVVYMGEEDTRRQAPNVLRMKLLGHRGRARDERLAAPSRRRSTRPSGTGSTNVEDTHYIIGTVAGPPLPPPRARPPVGHRPRARGPEPGAVRGATLTPSSPASAAGPTP